MKVFLSADMEGTCGIVSWPETERATPFDYAPMQKQMTREVAAACRGAFSAGADEVVVKDAHDTARNLDPAGLPRGIKIIRSWSGDLLSMMSGLDQDKYDAVFFTGYHAWASCPGNPLSHTMNLRNDHVTLNGVLCSEFLINAYTAGWCGVPVALVTGDKALCEFAKTLIPAITTVPVNEGRGGCTLSIHPDEAVERIEAAAKEAAAKADQCQVPMPDHFHMEIDFVKHSMAYSKSFYPGATLKEGKYVCYDTDDWYEMLRFCHFVLSDG
ncbi:MAG: M55 family metallopeptidase [Clostridia bacterium]|nr:M55 family metallopeptidase [Clostridia bacterium]